LIATEYVLCDGYRIYMQQYLYAAIAMKNAENERLDLEWNRVS